MTIASLARIPVVDVRHGGPVRHAAEGRARARALRDECIDWLPGLAAGLLPAMDGMTRLWLKRSHSPYAAEIHAIAAELDFSGIWFLNHPTVMLRRREVMNLGGYPSYRVAQDLGLWLKVFKAGLKIHNLPTVELLYRLHPNQVSTAQGLRLEEYAQIIDECWKPDVLMRAESA